VSEPQAWIDMVSVTDAAGELAGYYKKWHRPDGGVDNILRIHSLNPRSMAGHYEYYAHIMRGPSPLTRPQREMIAVVVSAANQCHY
jgi:alkylhydroperoxidase family enzyme